MRSDSVFVPRGFWLAAILAWTAALSVVSYVGTVKAARGLSILDCRVPNSALAPGVCLTEREAEWFWALLGNNVPWIALFGLVLPILAQAGIRAASRKLRS